MKIICILLTAFFYSTLLIAQDPETKIDERLIKCVVHLTIPATDPKLTSIGTGFLISVPNKEDFRVFLVTNKHMIGSWSLVDPFYPYDSVIIDFYTKEITKPIIQKTIKLKSIEGKLHNNAILHPNPRVDIALIDLTDTKKEIIKSGIDLQTADTSFLIRSAEMQKWKISYGDQVFAVGYPSNIMIAGTNLPIAKSSYIASSTAGDFRVELPVLTRKKELIIASPAGKFFLVDGLIIGGNSGGPVLCTNQTSMNFTEDKKAIVRAMRPSSIIGIVSMTLNGTGVAVIYSSDNILELINASLGKNLR